MPQIGQASPILFAGKSKISEIIGIFRLNSPVII